MRLIDADALMPLFMEKAFTMKDRHGVKLGENWLLDYEDIKNVIDNAPTVDITCPNCDSSYAQGYSDGYLKGKEERPQGEWINPSENSEFSNKEFFYDCSICGNTQMDETNFCPNCGADMRKETENES